MSKEHTIDDYSILCVIGKGCFGQIYLVKEVVSGQVYAMKVVKKRLIEKKNKLQCIFTERNLLIEVLASLTIVFPSFHHPNRLVFSKLTQVLFHFRVLQWRIAV